MFSETEPQELLNVLERLGAKKNGSDYVALCPAHADRNPSLSITVKNGKILLKCFSGCTTESVCEAAGLKMSDLFVEQAPERKIASTYDYVNEKDKTLFQVVRFEPKGFAQRRPDGKGGWEWKLGNVRRVLYRLPEILNAADVLVVEGEKDVETARTLGFVATTNAGGAGKWRQEYNPFLLAKTVVVIADADEPGRKHARQVCEAIYLRAASLKLIEQLPSLFGAKDLTEWIAEGNDADALKKLIAETREWTPDELTATVTAVDAKPGAESQVTEIALPDMPSEVLDGWLGEVCREKMGKFPVAYAWPALLTVASALVSRKYEKTRSNLYAALVGPVGSAKSEAIKLATELLGLAPPSLVELYAGSAEGLLRSKDIAEANGEPRLLAVDELGHLLEKSKIENSSFAFILNSAYYKTKFRVVMARGQEVDFNCALSIVGGLVDDRFEELFGSNTTGGMYDRFIFGLCPTGYVYDYSEDGEGGAVPGIGGDSGRPVDVRIDRSIWDALKDWKRDFPASREPELALRVAVVCAALDRRRVLTGEDLKPARAFADYQKRVRLLLKPNPGKNTDGIVTHKILEYLKRAPGEWLNVRKMFRDTNAYDFGSGVAQRCLNTLQFIGDVETMPDGKDKRVLLARIPFEPAPEPAEIEF